MKFEVWLFFLILATMILAAALHILYIRRIFAKVKKTAESDFKMSDLKKHLELPQGSNFNTTMLASWMLFSVALAFLFFQTPTIFPWNYFNLIHIASNNFGLTIFGLIVMVITSLLALSIPKVYKYYIVSRDIKRIMVYFAPVLLLTSIGISIYLGTIYPATDEQAWFLGYLTLAAPLLLLLMPIFYKRKETSR